MIGGSWNYDGTSRYKLVRHQSARHWTMVKYVLANPLIRFCTYIVQIWKSIFDQSLSRLARRIWANLELWLSYWLWMKSNFSASAYASSKSSTSKVTFGGTLCAQDGLSTTIGNNIMTAVLNSGRSFSLHTGNQIWIPNHVSQAVLSSMYSMLADTYRFSYQVQTHPYV